MSPFMLNASSLNQEAYGPCEEPTLSLGKVNGTKQAPPQSFMIPESLARYQISPAEYIEQRKPNLDCLVAGTVVAHHDAILLVQRSRHDYGGLCWEIPGGSCEKHDLSILGAAARELWEEAGLRATSIVDLVNDAPLYSTDGLLWAKLTFLVEVEQTGEGAPDVKLDPEEHEAFVWATEADVLANCRGDVSFTWISEDQRETILLAFLMLKKPLPEPLSLEVTSEA